MLNQFIGRKQQLDDFKAHLAVASSSENNQTNGGVIAYQGAPGIGKSTLLRKFQSICNTQEHPYCRLDMNGVPFSQGLEILFELSRSAYCFPQARSIAMQQEAQNNGDHNNLSKQWEYQEETINTVMSALEKIDPAGGIVANLIHAGIDFGQGWINRKQGEKQAQQISKQLEQQIAQNSEMFLLNILANAVKNLPQTPICFIDSYEHLFRSNQKITSRIEFDPLNLETVREGNFKEIPIANWMTQFIHFLQGNGWLIVVAGRTIQNSIIKTNNPQHYVEIKELERFKSDEITQAIEATPSFKQLLDSADSPQQKQASLENLLNLLIKLSFNGNPLWLIIAMNLVESLLQQGDTLEQLQQYPDYLQQCFESKALDDFDSESGIENSKSKLDLLERLYANTTNSSKSDNRKLLDQVWKIALPRILDDNLVIMLLDNNREKARELIKINRMVGAFISQEEQISKPTLSPPQGAQRPQIKLKQYRFHEEIRDLLLFYMRSDACAEKQQNKEISKQLHGKIFAYLVQQNQFDLSQLSTKFDQRLTAQEKIKNNQQTSWGSGSLL